MVVDSGSFAQRFSFRNPNSATINISPKYFPAVFTTQAVAFNCPLFTIAPNGDRTFNSLREMCPALAAGSQFGYLYTYEVDAANMPYSAYSRVSNPQGNGFSVEAFPAHTFTAAEATITGVRRLAAAGGAPAFQTNCFIGVLNDFTGPSNPANDFFVSVYNGEGAQVGATTSFQIEAGKLIRLLDVFAAVGAPAGNYDNARVRIRESGTGEPGVMSFCTVQDNSSFGADFRIGKQEEGASDEELDLNIGGQDDHVLRDSFINTDVTTSYAKRPFTLLTGGSRHNTHVMYFRHPDWVQCELINPATGVRALPVYGLEMRMLDKDGATVLAGGSNSTGWGELYLGDKTDRANGVNTRYIIEVENNAANDGADIPYSLHCRSGSGHSLGDIIEYNVGLEQF